MLITPLRPEREPLRNLAQAIAAALGVVENVETLLAGLQSKRAVNVLADCIKQLRTQEQQFEGTLLLTIDQAEELFTTAKSEQTQQLLDLLAVAEAEGLPIITLLAMRSDYLQALQQCLAYQSS